MPILPDDVSFNKAAIIERCIRRMHQEYAADPDLQNFTHVDALTLNIERACQAAIDLAMHLVASQRLGMPQNSGEAFTFLRQAGLIPEDLESRLRAMTGFRNVAIHQYQEMDVRILHLIASQGWRDLVAFCRALGLKIMPPPTE
jgi:uncharacterized protein YutE (UPF0331/DUF86 family)